MNGSVSEPQGLCALIRQVADSRRADDAERLNGALTEIGRLLETSFRAKIERRLESYREASRGYSVSLDDAFDVLNEILWTVCQQADKFRGQTDAEAFAWLQTTIERRVSDKGRTISRRAKKWREFFRIVPKRLKILLETEDARVQND